MLNILAYWLAIFSTILIEEHLIFRHGKWTNYNPEDFSDWRKLPLGVASFVALACGVAGAVLGMAQTWYIGVIGGMIGDPEFGGDIGQYGLFDSWVVPHADIGGRIKVLS